MMEVRDPASFRDPSGYVFRQDGRVYRVISETYSSQYERMLESGLHAALVERRFLIPHEDAEITRVQGAQAYRVLQPEPVPFISYPYEWCFSQLKDAALLTLDVHEMALNHGMVLKDATAFNVQFIGCRPIHIDTASFDHYHAGAPWQAYRQFCQHFLAPLLLMSTVDVRMSGLLARHLDGVPIDLASRALPRRTWMRWAPLLHVHLHARSLARHVATSLNRAAARPAISETAHRALIESLRSAVQQLDWTPSGTVWSDYELSCSYSEAGAGAKERIVAEYLGMVSGPSAVAWDIGANKGAFSRLAADAGARVVAFDLDPAAVEQHYRAGRGRRNDRVLPLVMDLANPTPGLGWMSEERRSWLQRGKPDVLMALALVHHIAIAGNVPLRMIAGSMARVGRNLIIEFVPKSDPQVQRLLGSREDVFPAYDRAGFEAAFNEHYRIVRSDDISESSRILYLMEARCTES